MFIGGSASDSNLNDVSANWTTTAAAHAHFVNPNMGNAQGCILNPIGTWYNLNGMGSGTSDCALYPFSYIAGGLDGQQTHFDALFENMRPCLGGDVPLTPTTIVLNDGVRRTLGVLDGIFHAPSEGQYVENTISAGGVDHLVVQNVFRTGLKNLWALALD
jgi:hypothetical protein